MTISRFTVVSCTNFQDSRFTEEWAYFYPQLKNKSSSLRLRAGGTDNLKEGETALSHEYDNKPDHYPAQRSLQIISPKSPNHATIPIWIRKDTPEGERRTLYIKNNQDLDKFNQLEPSNLLYLPRLDKNKLANIIDLRVDGTSSTYRYQLTTLSKLSEIIGLPCSLASKNSALSDVLFQQVDLKTSGNPIIIQVKSDSNIPDEPNNDYELVGWLNPVIFNFDINNYDLDFIQKSQNNEYHYLFHLLLHESAVLIVEPHLDESYDLRISFLMKLSEIKQSLTNDHKVLSLIEQIMLGSENSLSWKPFLILDSLGGEFSVCQNIDYPKPGIAKPLIQWKFPQDTLENKRWLAKYWLKQWVGEGLEYSANNSVIITPDSGRNYRSNRGLETLCLSATNDNSEDKISLVSLLSNHSGFKANHNNSNLYRFLVELLKNSSELKINESNYYRFWRSEQQKGKLVIEFDDVGFWEYFSKTHVAPQSRLLISVPLANEEEKFPQQHSVVLDPIHSIKFGAYHFIWELFNYLETDKHEEIIKIYNKFGWWNDWHATLFKNRWDVKLRLVSGFILGRSILGKERNYLAKKADRTTWIQKEHRFFSRTQ
jgi:hypothetical protein